VAGGGACTGWVVSATTWCVAGATVAAGGVEVTAMVRPARWSRPGRVKG
jgi:hypothetical protein